MNKLNTILAIALVAVSFTSCKKSGDDPIIVVPPSDGSTLTLNGLIGAEAGSSAGNSVFVDFSKDKQTSIARASWDLGFYGGDEFRVVLNHTVGATAIVLNKTDLNQVTAADTTGLATSAALALGQGAGGFDMVDPVSGGKAAYLAGTVIKEVSATDANNKVYIINRGAAGVTGNRGWQKVRILRSGNGYSLQYAKITETSFKTIAISKDPNYNFKSVSFVTGLVDVEPAKADWDIEWSLSTYKANATTPYTFSDFILLNFVGGVQAAQISTDDISYADYKESNIATAKFISDRDAIAGNWRSTSPATGVNTKLFYLIKDATGNVYKLKFVSMGAGDAGTRGKPVIEYKLIKKGA